MPHAVGKATPWWLEVPAFRPVVRALGPPLQPEQSPEHPAPDMTAPNRTTLGAQAPNPGSPGSPGDPDTDPGANSPAFLRAVSQLAESQRMVASRPICNQQGVKLLDTGARLDGSLYDRLFAHRLAFPLDESVELGEPVTGAALREATEAAIARLPFFALMAPAGRVRGMLLQAIEAIALPAPLAFHLTLARTTRPEVFDHGILMALMCAHLVREGGAPIHDMTTAAIAGLLHDLGMLHIDPALLEAKRAINGEARRPLDAHPIAGSVLGGRFYQTPRPIARAILEHHERLDGSGYPRGLIGDAISPLGRLLALCEVVTALFDGTRERPELRVSLLLRMNPRGFDPTLVPSVHRLLRALPADAATGQPGVDESVERLLRLERLLREWHAVVEAALPSLEAPARALLEAIARQARSFQRTLCDAGITAEQLSLVARSTEPGPALRAELSGLGDELNWNLRAAANQLRRRWRDVPVALPAELAAWLEAVEALDALAPAAKSAAAPMPAAAPPVCAGTPDLPETPPHAEPGSKPFNKPAAEAVAEAATGHPDNPAAWKSSPSRSTSSST
jgi:hypothetical protein